MSQIAREVIRLENENRALSRLLFKLVTTISGHAFRAKIKEDEDGSERKRLFEFFDGIVTEYSKTISRFHSPAKLHSKMIIRNLQMIINAANAGLKKDPENEKIKAQVDLGTYVMNMLLNWETDHSQEARCDQSAKKGD